MLTASAVLTSIALGPFMVTGSFVGKRIVDRLPAAIFVRIIEVVLVAAGVVFLLGA